MTDSSIAAAAHGVARDPELTALPTLRHAWFQASNLAIELNVTGLRPIIEARLSRIRSERAFDEAFLIDVVKECQAIVGGVAGDRAADRVARRMRRGIYEFLLARDACCLAEGQSAAAPAAGPQRPAGAAPAAPERAVSPRFAAIDMTTLRQHICRQLEAAHYQDVATLLTRVCRGQRGTELAAIACAAGVACRNAGEKGAAAACFQASCVADPEYEANRPRIAG